MKFKHTAVYNFENAIRGMRNPKNSWAKSDSCFGICDVTDATQFEQCDDNPLRGWIYENPDALAWITELHYPYANFAYIGENDLKLAQTLIKSGSEHRKFMRQIFVSVDITAPMYWWSEFDTYKVGTVANSTSKMHKLANTPITIECFEKDDICDFNVAVRDTKEKGTFLQMDILPTIDYLETLRQKYLETKDKKYWKELIRWLPESWLQTRTVTLTYENLLAMCSKGQRRFHKLNEWSGIDDPTLLNFIAWARRLPYAPELIFLDEYDGKQVA